MNKLKPYAHAAMVLYMSTIIPMAIMVVTGMMITTMGIISMETIMTWLRRRLPSG